MTPSAAASAFSREAAGAASSEAADACGKRVRALLDEARAGWPALVVDPARFIARLGELSDGSIERAEGLHVTDLWLALALSDGERTAYEAFERHVLGAVLDGLRQRGIAQSDRDEVAQWLRTEFLVPTQARPAQILRYAGRAPLRRWLTVAAARMLERAHGRAATNEALEDAVLPPALVVGGDLEAGMVRAEAKHLLDDALRRAVADLDQEDRVLLRLHVNDHVGIDDLARLYGIHRATAARMLERARRKLAQRTRSHLVARVALPPWEIDSLIRVVRSSFRSLVGTYLVTIPPA